MSPEHSWNTNIYSLQGFQACALSFTVSSLQPNIFVGLSSFPELNINAITHVRLVDVVGSNQNAFCSRDAGGRKVLDPWPTPFPSCGFDLDAVGVIHHNDPAATQKVNDAIYQVYPQPADGFQQVVIQDEIINFTLLSIAGSKVAGVNVLKNQQGFQIDTSTLQNGTYYMCIQLKNNKAICYSSQ